MDWKDNLVDSSLFYIRSGHENPTKFPIETRVQISDHVNIGNYELADELKRKTGKFQFKEITSDTRPEDPSIKLHSGLYYHCNDIFNPEVGDLRIQFSFAGLEGSKVCIVNSIILSYNILMEFHYFGCYFYYSTL